MAPKFKLTFEKSFLELFFLDKKCILTHCTAQWWIRSCTTIILFRGEKRSTLKSETIFKNLDIHLFYKVTDFWSCSFQVLAKETTLPKPREDPEGLLGSGRTLWSCAGSVKMSTWNKSLFTLARSNFTYFVFTKTELAPQCLKIIEKISFNIARYVCLEWTKVHWKCRK